MSLAAIRARPIAHRGLHGCGGAGPVENTIAAARAAIAAGYGIECDVQRTRDGEIVVFHDDALERLTGASGRVAYSRAADLAHLALHDGSRIPTLRDLLRVVRGLVPLVIEIKSVGDGDMRLADAVLDQASAYSGPLALESFDPSILDRCRNAPCAVGLVGPAEDGSPDPASLPRCDFVSWSIAHIAEIAASHPDLPRTTWTVRTEEQHATARACGAQIVFEGFQA